MYFPLEDPFILDLPNAQWQFIEKFPAGVLCTLFCESVLCTGYI